jgi:hypothetical protein
MTPRSTASRAVTPSYSPDSAALFTGLSRVQAVGNVGVKLRNQALADELWPPDPDKDSWSNVYSVQDFRLVHNLLYNDIRILMRKPRYPFLQTLPHRVSHPPS